MYGWLLLVGAGVGVPPCLAVVRGAAPEAVTVVVMGVVAVVSVCCDGGCALSRWCLLKGCHPAPGVVTAEAGRAPSPPPLDRPPPHCCCFPRCHRGSTSSPPRCCSARNKQRQQGGEGGAVKVVVGPAERRWWRWREERGTVGCYGDGQGSVRCCGTAAAAACVGPGLGLPDLCGCGRAKSRGHHDP